MADTQDLKSCDRKVVSVRLALEARSIISPSSSMAEQLFCKQSTAVRFCGRAPG